MADSDVVVTRWLHVISRPATLMQSLAMHRVLALVTLIAAVIAFSGPFDGVEDVAILVFFLALVLFLISTAMVLLMPMAAPLELEDKHQGVKTN